MYNIYQYCRFKNVNIKSKVIGLQRAWVIHLLNNKIRNWKILPLPLIELKFHFNLNINRKYVNTFQGTTKNL